MNTSQTKKGFTIIELMVTITLIAVLAGISTPFYSRFLLQNDVSNVYDQFASTFRKAQLYSMMGKQNSAWTVTYNSASHTLVLSPVSNPSYQEKFTMNKNITVSGFMNITFAKSTGIPTSGTPSTTPSITISGQNNNKTLSINSQGVVNR